MYIESNGAMDERFLGCIEDYLDFTFPKGYRNFLLKFNGGYSDKNTFNFKNSSEGSCLDILLGFIQGRYKNALLYKKLYSNRIPNNTFPIGLEGGGNLVLISVKGSDRGKIYFWDHEEEAYEDEEPDYSNLTLIADSFDEFLDGLHDYEEE